MSSKSVNKRRNRRKKKEKKKKQSIITFFAAYSERLNLKSKQTRVFAWLYAARLSANVISVCNFPRVRVPDTSSRTERRLPSVFIASFCFKRRLFDVVCRSSQFFCPLFFKLHGISVKRATGLAFGDGRIEKYLVRLLDCSAVRFSVVAVFVGGEYFCGAVTR